MLYRRLSSVYTPPIESLPVELLSYIFLLGTHTTGDLLDADDTDRSLPFNTESIKAPLVISSVNKHWRNVALNTPTLWTSLCVTAEMIHAQEDHDMSLLTSGVFNTGHLTTYIQRSRKYPLDILIDARDQDWDFSEPESVLCS
jgi:F-box-like